MATLKERISALGVSMATDIKGLTNMIGVLSALNTASKSNLVAALNELHGIAATNAAAIGPLAGLTTTSKNTLVAAINQVKAAVSAVDLTALIDDAALPGVINKTYSADKIVGLLGALETKIMGGITAEALDTVKELADFLSNETVANGIVSQMANRVRVDSAQSFTAEQQAQGRANIGAAAAADLASLTAAIGNTDHDFVAEYNAAKA